MRLTVLAAVLLAPTALLASGSLTISLQDERSRAIEGTATATPEGAGAARRCTTRGGRCTVTGLSAGRYRVSATLVRGGAAASSSAQVQDGRVTSVRLTASAVPTAPMSSATLRSAPSTATVPSGGVVRPAVPGSSPRLPGGRRSATAPGTGTRLTPVVPGATAPVPVRSDSGPHAGPVLMTGSATRTPARDLGTGTTVRIAGIAQDQRSRRVEGTVTIRQGATTLGTVSTTGGSFSVFDLGPGTYALAFVAVSGQRTSRSVTVGGGPAISVRLLVER